MTPSETTCKEILSKLGNLDQGHLKQVKASVEFFLDDGPVEDELYKYSYIQKAIWDVLKSRGRKFISVSTIKQMKLYSAYKTALEEIDAFVTSSNNIHHKDQKYGLSLLIVELAVESMETAGIPIIPKTLMDNLKHAPMYFERSFPGYAGANLTGHLIKRVSNG